MERANIQRIGFGGGCHWCTEAVFSQLEGVHKVKQGWISSFDESESENKNEDYSEAVIVHYNPLIISLEALIKVHLHTHSSSSDHPMRKKYRSAIYYFDSIEVPFIESVIETCRDSFAEALITKVLPFGSFKLNQEKYLDYFQKNPDAPFCTRYIAPKLEKLKVQFPKLISANYQ